MPLGCAVHHSACTEQCRGLYKNGQVFTVVHGGVVEYRANQNATHVSGLHLKKLQVGHG